MCDLEEPLERLERKNHRLRQQSRWTKLGVLAKGYLMFLGGVSPETRGEIAAESCELWADQGWVRARLGITTEGLA